MAQEPVTAALDPVVDVARAIKDWKALEPFCETTVFQSAAWLAPWLESAVGRFDVRLVRAETGGVAVGFGFLVRRRMRRRLFSVHTLFVNEAGPSDIDFCIEHNGFLLHREHEEEALLAILECLRETLFWDELSLRRCAPGAAVQRLPRAKLAALGLRLRVTESTVAPYVDLDLVRARGGDYLNGLTGNRRAQIRRALRRLEAHGPMHVVAAKTVAEAMEFFEGLKEYHQRYWEARGEPGAFASAKWEAFHRRVIADQLASGGAQLLRVSAGAETVGYIYSLVRAGIVSMVQSGFNYGLDPKSHPGECCHVLAIEWNLRAGHRVYDFLAGDMRYKRSLANGVAPVEFIVLQRKRWRFLVEDALRTLYHRAQRYEKPEAAPAASGNETMP